MIQQLHNSILPNYIVRVRKSAIEKDLTNVIVQFHRFPGTNSTVAHASLAGVELAIATSPCIDPRNYQQALGEHYSSQKALKLAEDKLWEMHGIILAEKLVNSGLSEKDFYEKYKDEYLFTEIKDPVKYKEAKLPV